MQSFVGVLFILVLFDAAGAVFKIKVSKFESERNRQLRLGIAPDHSVFTSEPKSLTPHDYYDLEYTATVYLGSEKTPIRVVLDTGSADFWVPDVTCGICDYYCHGLNAEFCAKLCAQGCCDVNNNFTTSKCLGKQFFDAKTSSTYQVHNGTFRLKYGAGEASGFYGSDILDFAGLQTRVIFGQVTEIDAVIKYDTNFDGILGLAFQSLSIDKTPPPFVAAFRQGLVESPVFTAFLRKGGFRNMQDGGEFTFGGFDGDNCDYSDLKYVKLTYPAYYQFALDGLKKMECQVEKTEHLRHLILFEFNRGCSAANAARNINAVYGKGFASERTTSRWFARFRSGNFDVDDASRSGRPVDHPQKVMLCVWWGLKGIVHWELLPKNQTITAEVYSAQLQRVADALEEQELNLRYGTILQHDNARPHVAKFTREKLLELGWEVLHHPPYSPDLAPSDYHLFRALSNALSGVSFDNEEELQNWLQNWFDSKDEAFYRRGIEKLPERWQKVVDSEGEYIVD